MKQQEEETTELQAIADGDEALDLAEDRPVELPKEEEPAQPNAVFVEIARQEDGNFEIKVSPIGDVRLTEVSSILKLAQRQWAQKYGL